MRPYVSKRLKQSIYGAFHDTQTQSITSTTDAYALHFNTTDISHGVSILNDDLGNPTKIYIGDSGTFNIQFSGQLVSGTASTKTVDFWLSKNGVDVADSNTRITVAGNNSYQVAAWNFLVEALKHDYFQIKWCASDINVSVYANGASTSPSRPEIPSIILTVTEML